ncbi:MAG: FkbM family methyltransferase [Candidatus Saccharibacteria bacterium]|nr:FkbM family methyltransferase [Candidatus Saccharibacteria bacterium]
MISKDTFPVYAQYNEDVILGTLLSEVKKGFYVDVGANNEEYHSVTKYFYDRGWRGINIEPIPRLIEGFLKKRQRDINLNIAVSSKKGTLKFREYPEHDGLSTFSEPLKENASLPHKDYMVKVDRLANILKEHNVEKIDFLKIDVEGYEAEVLKSNDWSKYRPTVLCVEANKQHENWPKYIKDNGYELSIFDGLNQYYIAKEALSIMEGFAEKAAIMAHNALRNHHIAIWKEDIARIKFLEEFASRQDELIKSTQRTLVNLDAEFKLEQAESMRGKSLLRRLRVAAYGLTLGYIKDRK